MSSKTVKTTNSKVFLSEIFYNFIKEGANNSILFASLQKKLDMEILNVIRRQKFTPTSEQIENTSMQILEELFEIKYKSTSSPSEISPSLGAFLKAKFESDDYSFVKLDAYIKKTIKTALRKHAPARGQEYLSFLSRVTKALKVMEEKEIVKKVLSNHWAINDSKEYKPKCNLVIDASLKSKLPLNLRFAKDNPNNRLMAKGMYESIELILADKTALLEAYSNSAIATCLFEFCPSNSIVSLDTQFDDKNSLYNIIENKKVSSADIHFIVEDIIQHFFEEIDDLKEESRFQVLYACVIPAIIEDASCIDEYPSNAIINEILNRYNDKTLGITSAIELFLNKTVISNLKAKKIKRVTAHNRIETFRAILKGCLEGEVTIVHGIVTKRIIDTIISTFFSKHSNEMEFSCE